MLSEHWASLVRDLEEWNQYWSDRNRYEVSLRDTSQLLTTGLALHARIRREAGLDGASALTPSAKALLTAWLKPARRVREQLVRVRDGGRVSVPDAAVYLEAVLQTRDALASMADGAAHTDDARPDPSWDGMSNKEVRDAIRIRRAMGG